MRVTSGNRTPEHNKKVGGVKNSYHLKHNRALDIQPMDWDCIGISQLAEYACLFATTIKYPRHVHIDNRKKHFCIKGKYKKGLTKVKKDVIIDIEKLDQQIKQLEKEIDEIINDMSKVKQLNFKLDDLEQLLVQRENYYTLRLV